ncbi:MAG: AbrB family transcriptional regulator [Thermoproteota archaeon]|jgi:AbrB family looped-hinge helix DNA binding protein|uniref:AbrB/MazE/SpoVT family DNA-binding domain-containing protein n=1 Tax=Candidatus Methanodesulfokora washburnensis TaxID=2478471 RepID=A0A3R9PGT6_9CREN|nr:AbrB/MazE/SpoVT family DNA-binding domain-containing protein [Candidatus Methanodesulfokores washburnensis]RSN74011.1 AbrB/MazE/SpoVT family DNA-binding domain-containing protein [Candidatus Methanodesulfokores washburnensis]RZN61011.1 MAG: AbrB/MazE/SpoVT family DNA-binding domain-containing protein [Candidatus Methanodesulfokores washburnensis]TDA38458.1 MAG: AbrB family transcriptional regulator [Candidatus Korarchaeota archaeon]
MIVEVKRVDNQGRIVLPKKWRERWGDEIILIELEDRIEILPRRKPNFSQFFDIIEADIEEDIEKELLEELI